MRGLELLLGGILVVSGVAAPLATDAGLLTVGGDVEAQAWFYDWSYTGNAEVQTPEAGLYATGPVNAIVRGTVKVDVFEYEEIHHTSGSTRGEVGPLGWNYTAPWRAGWYSHEVSETYENATLRILGEPDAALLGWTNETGPRGSMALTLANGTEASVHGSAYAKPWGTPGGHVRYMMDAPLIALAHDGPDEGFFEISHLTFERLRATGTVTFVVMGGAGIVAEHEGDVKEHRTWYRPGDDTRYRLGNTSAGTEVGAEVRYAIVTLQDAELVLGFEDLEAVLVTQKARWTVNGTVAFDAEEGNLRSDDDRQSIDGDRVEILGNTTLDTRAEGEGSTARDFEEGTTPNLLPLSETELHAELDGDAQEVSVNGERLQTTAPPAIPEEATLIAKLLGALLVAWSVLKRLFLVVMGTRRRALLHPRRRRIHRYIEASGLAHMRQIERATTIPVGSLNHHLEVLEDADLVHSIEAGDRRVFFVPSTEWSWSEMRSLALLAEPTRHRIAQALTDGGAHRQAELQRLLELSQPHISQQLDKLVEAGLVDRQGRREIDYAPTPLLRRWIEHQQPPTGHEVPEPVAEVGASEA